MSLTSIPTPISTEIQAHASFGDQDPGGHADITTESLQLETGDGFHLAGTLYLPVGQALGTVIINSATAVPQVFYRRYARYLAGAGMRVLTYDYRGIGQSRPDSLRGFRATLSDWADHDARAAFRFVSAGFPGAPLAFVGHSFGGQLIGLVDELRAARASVLVGAQLGYWGNWPAAERARYALYWYGLVPAITRVWGYLPGKAGLGADLPAGVALEWARWCRHPDYLFGHRADAKERIARFDRPTLLYAFTDDAYAPSGAVQAFVRMAQNPRLELRTLRPSQLGVR
ncbi:MAG TPA: alpha/beta fold hydrolase, partial [Polyangiaceae bacterium]